MGNLKDGINKLIDAELKDLEVKKAQLNSEINELEKKILKDRIDAEKEIAKKNTDCDIECAEKIAKANTLLKEAQEKNDTADKRKEDLSVIEKKIDELNKKTKEQKSAEATTEGIRVSCFEKERKADLLIEQYSKKIKELDELEKHPKKK